MPIWLTMKVFRTQRTQRSAEGAERDLKLTLNLEVMTLVFDRSNFQSICDELGRKDKELKKIISNYGYPPMWVRPQGFSTLINIILEQQVSLASAKAAFNKLKEKTGSITPANLLKLSDTEMKACYFSRQKMVYARHLAETLINKKIMIRKLAGNNDDDVRNTLKQVKGIGDWTVDVYLMFAMQRADVFPTGDLAMMNSLKKIKNLKSTTTKENILAIAEPWRPYRSVATYLLWHNYLEEKKPLAASHEP